MRKISKISLVAAVAVAGFSTANAQPLEEAIKNVDVSGSVVYRYDNSHNEASGGTTTRGNGDSGVNKYKIGLNLSSKVNDYVKFNSRFIVGSDTDAGFAPLDSKKDTGADEQADVSLSNAYFGLTAIPNTVVNIGKQGLATPYTVATDINGNEQTGTGILALTTVGAVTAGIGYFNATNLNESGDGAKNTAVVSAASNAWGTKNNVKSGSDVYVATLQGDLDFVKLEAWYLGLQNTFDTYTLAATSKLDLAKDANINLEARYVDLELDKKIAQGDIAENSMFRFAVDGKFNIVNARLAYTKTGKHGGLTATDQDAKNASLAWNATSLAYANADFYQAALGADILDNLNFTMNYANLTSEKTDVVGALNKNDAKIEEVYGQLTYKMSKNLNTYVRYGNITEERDSDGKESKDQNMGRIQVAYSF